MTKREAKKLCLIKWKYAMDTGCANAELTKWLFINHREVFDLVWECAYCELYIASECSGCPLYKIWGKRCNPIIGKSPYKIWLTAKTVKTRKKYATIIHDDIKRS